MTTRNFDKTQARRDVEGLQPRVQAAWADLSKRLKARGVHVVITETLRTEERQAWLRAKGASKVSRSKHQDGLALDVMLDDKKHQGEISGAWDTKTARGRELWFIFGEEAERVQVDANGQPLGSFRWGGRFNSKGDLPQGQRAQLGWDAGHIEWRDA